MVISPQRPPLYNGHFLADSLHIDSRLNLYTTANLFCPQGGRCGVVQL